MIERAGLAVVQDAPAVMPALLRLLSLEGRPYRRRPRLVKGAPAAGSGRLLVEPDPEDAAREILAYLRRIGVLAPPASGPQDG